MTANVEATNAEESADSEIAKVGLERWHKLAKNMTSEGLDELLAEEVVFHSPIVHSPQEGRDITKLYLMAAFNVLPGEKKSPGKIVSAESKFRYVREVVGERDAVLEFMTEMNGIQVNGIDMIRWNEAGQIIEFKVMIRPLKAIQQVHAGMAKMLEAMKPAE